MTSIIRSLSQGWDTEKWPSRTGSMLQRRTRVLWRRCTSWASSAVFFGIRITICWTCARKIRVRVLPICRGRTSRSCSHTLSERILCFRSFMIKILSVKFKLLSTTYKLPGDSVWTAFAVRRCATSSLRARAEVLTGAAEGRRA